jgi:hypothetical protein
VNDFSVGVSPVRFISFRNGLYYGMSDQYVFIQGNVSPCLFTEFDPIQEDYYAALTKTFELLVYYKQELSFLHGSTYYIDTQIKIKSKNQYFSKEARDIWQVLNKNYSFRLMDLCCVGDSIQYQSSMSCIY